VSLAMVPSLPRTVSVLPSMQKSKVLARGDEVVVAFGSALEEGVSVIAVPSTV